MISRRQLLQSLAGLPFLGVLKPSEPPLEGGGYIQGNHRMTAVPKGYREQFRLLETGAVPLPLEGKTGQAHFSGYITLTEYESNGIVYNVESGRPIRVR